MTPFISSLNTNKKELVGTEILEGDKRLWVQIEPQQPGGLRRRSDEAITQTQYVVRTSGHQSRESPFADLPSICLFLGHKPDFLFTHQD